MAITKGSRFYFFGPLFCVLAFALSWRASDASAFVTLTSIWMGMAGAKSVVGTHKGTGQ